MTEHPNDTYPIELAIEENEPLIAQAVTNREPTAKLVSEISRQRPEIKVAVVRDAVFDKIVQAIREKHPGRKLQQISINELPDDLFLMKEVNWAEYEAMDGIGDTEGYAQHREIVERFLLYPKPTHEYLGSLLPGYVRRLADEILSGLGFRCGIARKKV